MIKIIHIYEICDSKNQTGAETNSEKVKVICLKTSYSLYNTRLYHSGLKIHLKIT